MKRVLANGLDDGQSVKLNFLMLLIPLGRWWGSLLVVGGRGRDLLVVGRGSDLISRRGGTQSRVDTEGKLVPDTTKISWIHTAYYYQREQPLVVASLRKGRRWGRRVITTMGGKRKKQLECDSAIEVSPKLSSF